MDLRDLHILSDAGVGVLTNDRGIPGCFVRQQKYIP